MARKRSKKKRNKKIGKYLKPETWHRMLEKRLKPGVWHRAYYDGPDGSTVHPTFKMVEGRTYLWHDAQINETYIDSEYLRSMGIPPVSGEAERHHIFIMELPVPKNGMKMPLPKTYLPKKK
jgi:hypothetical protein